MQPIRSHLASPPFIPTVLRQIRTPVELERIQSRIKEAFSQLQDVDSQAFSRGSPCYLGTTQEQDLVNLIPHVHDIKTLVTAGVPSTYQLVSWNEGIFASKKCYSDFIEDLHSDLKGRYLDLEETEIALILVETLLSKRLTRRFLADKVWAEVFNQPRAGWDKEIGDTATSVIVYLLKVELSHASEPNFLSAFRFLETAEKSLSVDYLDEWISRTVIEINKFNFQEREIFRKDLATQTGTLFSKLLRELELSEMLLRLENNDVRGGHFDYDQILTALSKGHHSSRIWCNVLNQVVLGNDVELKKKACEDWLNHPKFFTHENAYQSAWLHASKLLMHADPAVVANFYLGPEFSQVLGILSTDEATQTLFYQEVFECAKRSLKVRWRIAEADQKFLLQYPKLKSDRLQSTLAKLREETGSKLKGVLEDIDGGFVSHPSIWGLILEKAPASKSNDLKKKVWELWNRPSNSVKDDLSQSGLWVRASELLDQVDPVHAVNFFCGPNFIACVEHCIQQRLDVQSFYETALINAKQLKGDRARLLASHQNYMLRYPELLNHRTYTLIKPLLSSQALKVEFFLLYATDKGIKHKIVNDGIELLHLRLRNDLPHEETLRLAEVVADIGEERSQGAINYFELASSLTNKAKGAPEETAIRYQDLALKLALWGLCGASTETKEKERFKLFDKYFDLLSAIIPKVSNQGCLVLAETVKLKEIQKQCLEMSSAKWMNTKALNFWKVATLRLLKSPLNETAAITFASESWEILKGLNEDVIEVMHAMTTAALTMLPSQSYSGTPGYKKEFPLNISKAAILFNDVVKYRVGASKKLTIFDPFEALINSLSEAKRINPKQQYFILGAALQAFWECKPECFDRCIKSANRLLEAIVATIDADSMAHWIEYPKISYFAEYLYVFLYIQCMVYNLNRSSETRSKVLQLLNAMHILPLGKILESGQKSIDSTLLEKNVARADLFDLHKLLDISFLTNYEKLSIIQRTFNTVAESIFKLPPYRWQKLVWMIIAYSKQMIEKGANNEKEVSLDYLIYISKIYDEFAERLLKHYDKTAHDPVLRSYLLDIFLEIVYFQANYTERSTDEKFELIKPLLKIATDIETTLEQQLKIIKLAIDSKFENPLRTITVKLDEDFLTVLKGSKTFVSVDDNGNKQRRQEGTLKMFEYLWEEAQKGSHSSLLLCSNLFTQINFSDFDGENESAIQKIYSDVEKAIKDHS